MLYDELFLETYKNYSEMGNDVWVFHQKNDQDPQKLRLRLTYNWCDEEKFKALLERWDDETISRDKENIETIVLRLQ